MSADNHLRSMIDRILRLKEEADAINADVREVYAEAKSQGFDKTQMGNVVSYLRKRAKHGAAELQEGEAIFDLYLNAYLGTAEASHTHAPAHVREETPDHDPETGEVVEPTEPADAAVTAGNDLRKPVAAEQGQIVRGGDAPREASNGEGSNAAHPATEFENAPEPSNRDVSAGDEPSPEAGPQAEASPSREQETGTPAGHEGDTAGEAASADLPTKITIHHDEPRKVVIDPEQADPGCKRPDFCGQHSRLGLCTDCRAAAGEVREAAE